MRVLPLLLTTMICVILPLSRADPGVDSRIAQVKAQVKAQMGVLVLEGKVHSKYHWSEIT